MRWRVFVLFAAGFFAAATCAHAQDSTPHQAEYLKIYLKINDADEMERNGDYRGALANFKDCYARLQKIHNSDPSWESALVIHRMDDCQAKILYLESEVAKMPAEPPVSEDNAGGGMPPGASAPSAEVDELRQRLNDVTQQLQDVQAKYQNSQLEDNDLRTQLDAANQELIALKSGQTEDERMGKLLEENKKLTDKLADAEKQIATIKPANPHSALALARADLKNTQDKLAASEAANTALQTTVTTLQSQLDQAQTDLRGANQRLADAAPSNPDYEKLKRENEIMRDILTRELQEQAHRDMAKRLAQEEFDRLKITSQVLQQQLDILGSPMTPPTSDQERILLDSLKTTPVQVASPGPEGNNFAATTPSASATPDTNNVTIVTPPENPNAPAPDTNMASATTPSDTNAAPANPATASADTNAAPATPAPDTNMASATTPSDTNAAPADTNMASATTPSDTNAAPANPATASADTNSAPSSTPSTNMASTTTPSDTNAAPADTNMASTPAAPSDTNASAPVPPNSTPTGTTTVTDTTINNGGSQQPSDTTDYSTKARLPDDMRDTAQQAADLFKMQRYDEAADKYQSIIEKYPDSLYAWSNLGVVRFQQGKLPEALKALQQAVKLSPTDAFSYSNLGIVYYQLGQYENAISALERALALDPSNAMSHNYLGCACSQKGWQEVAEKEFTKAIELNDNFADAHFNLALIYATEKPPSLEMARRHYKRALELGIQPNPQLEKLLRMDESQVSDAVK
jgi:tetratricopeptide (TPR) repeat protein